MLRRLGLVVLLSALVLVAAPAAASIPEGYDVVRGLFESDLESAALEAFPDTEWSKIAGSTLFPAENFFRTAKDPVQGDKALLVPFYAPGEAGNSYICTPSISAKDADYLLFEFDLYMASAKFDAKPNAGVYLFGALDWPPHTEVYIQTALKNAELDRWVHYDWMVDVKANKNYLYVDGKKTGERSFRTKGLDPAQFRVAIYGTVNQLNVYYDNIKLSVASAK